MNVVKFQGGLGNQMFQYALYRKFERKGVKVKGDLTWFEANQAEVTRPFLLGAFKINIDKEDAPKVKGYRNILSKRLSFNLGIWPMIYKEKASAKYDKEVFGKRNVLLDGYWQSGKYFDDIKDILIEDFEFPKEETDFERNLLKEIQSSSSVSVHIRCGDYLLHDDIYGGICTLEYYEKAIKTVISEVENPKFFVFSDDMERAKDMMEKIGADSAVYVNLPEGTGEIHDMHLMSCCKHNIIANSSFSWWGSYLNVNPNKHIYAPDKWKKTGECTDIFCEDWTIIK